MKIFRIATLLVLLGVGTLGFAHEKKLERDLTIQFDEKGGVLFWETRVFGKQARLFETASKLRGEDDAALRWARLGYRGVDIQLNGKALRLQDFGAKLQKNLAMDGGAEKAWAGGSFVLPPEDVEIFIGIKEGSADVAYQFSMLGPWCAGEKLAGRITVKNPLSLKVRRCNDEQ